MDDMEEMYDGAIGEVEAACGHMLSPDRDDAPLCEGCARCERCCACGRCPRCGQCWFFGCTCPVVDERC